MLEVTVHSGLNLSCSESNLLAVLDVAYEKKSELAGYVIVLSLRGSGEVSPAFVRNCPRWSASVWGLVARPWLKRSTAPTKNIYQQQPDGRCA